MNYRNRSDLSLQDIAPKLNPILRGWIAYYQRFQPLALGPLYRYINMSLVAWARRKYKRFCRRKPRAGIFMSKVSQKCPLPTLHINSLSELSA
jgi:RNA-directed DNA polymerase